MRRALLAVAVVLGVALAAGPAAAHDDQGEMTVIDTVPAADGRTVRIDVGIVYSGDGHLADEAEVTVTGVGPDGAELDAAPLAHASGGRYSGTVVLDVPGAWSLTVTSTNPESSAPVEVVVEGPDATTTSTTEAATTSTTEAAEVTIDSEPGEGASILVPVLSAIGVATLAIFGVALYLRGRKLRDDT